MSTRRERKRRDERYQDARNRKETQHPSPSSYSCFISLDEYRGKSLGIYTRASKGEQSYDYQLRSLVRDLKENNIYLLFSKGEKASGTSLRRPVLLNSLNLARGKGIYVSDITRLARNPSFHPFHNPNAPLDKTTLDDLYNLASQHKLVFVVKNTLDASPRGK